MRLFSGWKKGRGTDVSAPFKKKQKAHGKFCLHFKCQHVLKV